ncbi:MAG: FecR domain-containing protein [Prolixibacteraceae bacterium]
MKQEKNIDFESLVEDGDFIRAVTADKALAREYLLNLCRENPGKEEIIGDAAGFIQHYQLKKTVDQETVAEMWKSVIQKWGDAKMISHFRIGMPLKIAASVAIIVSLGFYIYYSVLQRDSLREYAEEPVEAGDEARIIISDGSEYPLKENEANVRYDVDGREIVIEEKGQRTETLANSSETGETILNQIIVPYGRRHSLTLSDGTVVHLNSGSKLVFPAKFSDNNRRVYLKGEGYFNVVKKGGIPFIVKTDYVDVKVLGTQFNITAYTDDHSLSTVLVEGSVKVYSKKFLRNSGCEIAPGQGYFYSGTNDDFVVRDVDVNDYISWTKGVLLFRDQTFLSVVEKIKKYYNVSIVVKDELAERRITGKLVLSDNIEETLAYLASTTKSKYFDSKGSYLFMK